VLDFLKLVLLADEADLSERLVFNFMEKTALRVVHAHCAPANYGDQSCVLADCRGLDFGTCENLTVQIQVMAFELISP